jgi:hypothetical protein
VPPTNKPLRIASSVPAPANLDAAAEDNPETMPRVKGESAWKPGAKDKC